MFKPLQGTLSYLIVILIEKPLHEKTCRGFKFQYKVVFLRFNSKNEKMIMVTGATGLVGGHLLWYLLQENECISAIRRPTSDLKPLRTIFSFYTHNPDDFLDKIDWKTADVLDSNSITKAMIGVDTVYHCAAIVSLGNSENIILNTNVTGTKNVVRAALQIGIKKLCFVSSIAACGKVENSEIIDENGNWIDSPNRSLYSRSKYFSEQEIWNGITNGLNAVIVNPGVILGVSSQETGILKLFSQVRKGLKFYTNGGSGYVDVQDVVKVMIQLVNSEISGQRFILVGENCSNKEVLSWMADGFGKRYPFIGVGKRTMLSVGYLSEFFGKLFHFNPLIDIGTAKSAVISEKYSSQKIEQALEFKFKSIEKCIKEVSDFQAKQI